MERFFIDRFRRKHPEGPESDIPLTQDTLRKLRSTVVEKMGTFGVAEIFSADATHIIISLPTHAQRRIGGIIMQINMTPLDPAPDLISYQLRRRDVVRTLQISKSGQGSDDLPSVREREIRDLTKSIDSGKLNRLTK